MRDEAFVCYANCNCILYYMPRSPNASICGYSQHACVKRVEKELQIKGNSSFKRNQCLSGCYAMTYDSTFSTAKIFDRVPFLTQIHLEPKNVAILHTYYGRSLFRSQKKEELVGFTDFLCKTFESILIDQSKLSSNSYSTHRNSKHGRPSRLV